MDNLPELKDIHLPTDGVSIFPLAKGWWIIVATAVVFFILFKIFLWLRRNSKKIYARYLLKKYAADNTASAVVKMSEILRRICVSRYPKAVSLTGEKWLNFLNSHSKTVLSSPAAKLLENAPYAPESSSIFKIENIEELRKFCQNWIGENL